MNRAVIAQDIERIRGAVGDWEQAHGELDDLYKAFIGALSDGTLDGDPRELAALVLTARALVTTRWYA